MSAYDYGFRFNRGVCAYLVQIIRRSGCRMDAGVYSEPAPTPHRSWKSTRVLLKACAPTFEMAQAIVLRNAGGTPSLAWTLSAPTLLSQIHRRPRTAVVKRPA